VILPILGLDIDQEFFAACLLVDEGKHRRKFKNTQSGFRDLSSWLVRFGVDTALSCMEATGRYGEQLAGYLYALGHKVAVVNPSFISSHKTTLNKHNKTDPTDAEAICDYARCFATRIRFWQPRSKAHQQLIDVQGQMELIKKTIVAFSNRSGCGIESQEVRASSKQTIDVLEEQLKAMETLRDELYKELPSLKETREILDSVPGIGREIADSLAAKIDFSTFQNGRDLAAFLGIGSREWSSGKQKRRGKQTKAGNNKIRAILRMGAMAASYGKNSYYQEFVERLRQSGLKEGQIMTAVARKMILIAHALVRKKQLFDCCYQHPLKKAS
jgi:transposase